jgi:hypothetical protein
MMSWSGSFRKRWLVPLVAAIAVVPAAAVSAVAGEQDTFTEETGSAFWSVPHTCADGTVVAGTLAVISTRDFELPETEDADPTTRVQFQAVCPDGFSFTWGANQVPSTITSTPNLKSIRTVGSGAARDSSGGTHTVTFDVTYTGVGPIVTEVNGPGSTRREREATATGVVTFDGTVIVNGANNHPTRPAPFIRVDIEKGS